MELCDGFNQNSSLGFKLILSSFNSTPLVEIPFPLQQQTAIRIQKLVHWQ